MDQQQALDNLLDASIRLAMQLARTDNAPLAVWLVLHLGVFQPVVRDELQAELATIGEWN